MAVIAAGCGPAVPEPELSLTWTDSEPSSCSQQLLVLTLYTEGDAPDSVVLLANAEHQAVLAPPFQFFWNCASRPEGTYELSARAYIGEYSFQSAPRMITVDHTAPTLELTRPFSAADDTTIDILFSESIDPSLITGSTIKWEYALSGYDYWYSTPHTLEHAGSEVTLTASSALDPDYNYRIIISNEIMDAAGNRFEGLEQYFSVY